MLFPMRSKHRAYLVFGALIALVILATCTPFIWKEPKLMRSPTSRGKTPHFSGAKEYAFSPSGLASLPQRGSSPQILRNPNSPLTSTSTKVRCTQVAIPQQGEVQTPQVYKQLDPSSGPRAMEGITTVILDQDGVLWRGTNVFPTTLPTLERFKELGIRVLFVTNNAAKSRKQYVEKWRSVGLEITEDEIVPASYMSAAYLESIGFKGKILFIGDEGTRLELQEHGFEVVECGEDHIGMNNEELVDFKLDSEVKAVVLAHDPNFSYRKLAIATQYLRNPDCKFVVTNMDAGDMLDNNRFMPGTGGIAQAITTITGRTPVNTGKGGDFILPFLMGKYGVKPAEMMCVGDRLDTDIALGRQANCKSAMPLTGVTSREQLQTTPPEKQPTYVMDNFGILAGLDFHLTSS
mmetsp:Transcript_16718/g.23389  ORF Transcript_16718/g.23389 Transcript_16718/m.23389 type:complete len:406 (+) Transcript_16718:388-1605(+)|eukprot:CAMPEP_0184482364 /NCGR_PEP_ID=MMETSP0113_2-20130426/3927_1 /TAXON_ID=91329 /ORGANISM="Norrisiella sphaerica, Strain BC52" /LENGTH=405 /DNA_ID=CAMNT_0026862051 /DNA_START=388 /DNA_END=1605 /DNA_ORIENTATION=-